LKGAGRGSRIEARYTGNLDVKLGSLKAKWKLVVADISDDIILGIDVTDTCPALSTTARNLFELIKISTYKVFASVGC
jgi:hypothetical protein